MKKRWRCRLRRRSFGLSDKYIENVYEQFFTLKYHGGWSFIEVYNLPVVIREWFLKRLVKQFRIEREQVEKASKSGGQSGELGAMPASGASRKPR